MKDRLEIINYVAGRLLFIVFLSSMNSASYGAGIVSSVIAGATAKAVAKSATKTEGDWDDALSNEAKKMNAQLPKMVDPDTRLDRVTTAPNKLVTYQNTMVHLARDQVDLASFYGVFKPDLIRRICANDGLKPMIAAGAALTYTYKTRDALNIGSIRVSAAECRGE